MNFFKRQDQARGKTALLIFYLLIAVALIVLAVNLVVLVAAVVSTTQTFDIDDWLNKPWWPVATATTLAIIAVGSLLRFIVLRRGGGRAVAGIMGARPVPAGTRDPQERRFINIVEEMSIASGTPVPELYVMDEEPGINAFVAGYRPTQAVMVVTRGALEHLDRDELQGVVGHEFSHILNGDMRINLRIMAILAGILSLGMVGRAMMRSMFSGARVRGSTRSRGAHGQALVFVLGIGLLLIGYIGLFFGRLIKAAVSRQRELLADASSVQFTRYPRPLAEALWKIKHHHAGSLLESRRAEETSHMCFGESMRVAFHRLMATHPPIDERIRRIDRHFEVKKAAERFRPGAEAGPPAGAAAGGPGPQAAGFAAAADSAVVADAADLAARVGNPAPEHMDYAVGLHRSIPSTLLDAIHDSVSAPAFVYALLLGDVAEERARVAEALVRHEIGPDAVGRIRALRGELDELDVRYRLPLLELAIPALRSLPEKSRETVLKVADKLVRIDSRITLFEFVLLTLLRKHLKAEAAAAPQIRYRRFDPVLPEIRILLTLMARAGASESRKAEEAFRRAMRPFTSVGLPQADEAYCKLEGMSEVLDKLSGLAPLLKQPLLQAAVDCVLHDGVIAVREGELLRAVAEALDCPMPPLAVRRSA